MMSLSLMELGQWTGGTLAKEGLIVNKKIQMQLFGQKELVPFKATF